MIIIIIYTTQRDFNPVNGDDYSMVRKQERANTKRVREWRRVRVKAEDEDRTHLRQVHGRERDRRGPSKAP